MKIKMSSSGGIFILEIILNVMEILEETLYTIIDGCREFCTRQQK